MTLTRRHLCALLPACASIPRIGHAAPTVPPQTRMPPDGQIAFAVWRGTRQIGTHQLAFATTGETTRITAESHLRIAAGPFTVFAYTQQVTETWVRGVLQAMTATTNDDGTRRHCSIALKDGSPNGGTLQVDGSATGPYTAPPGSLPGTHWNIAELQGPIIDPRDGTLTRFAVAPPALDAPPGQTTAARHYRLRAPTAAMDLWYDSTPTWTGLTITAQDHSQIQYRRLSEPVR